MTEKETFEVDDLLTRVLQALNVARGPDRRGEYVAWCVFHPDGGGTPPHRPNLHVSERGFYCHACGRGGSLRELAGKLGLANETANSKEDAMTTYDYRDETGTLLFQVVRKQGKKFVQRRPDGDDGWIWKLDGTRRVLYRLPEVLGRREEAVYLVEGEKDADALAAQGLLATTNPGGAGKWRDEFAEPLRGRDVVILPDNDDAGRRHAREVASSLAGAASSVKVVELTGLPQKGDVSDWLAAGHSPDELASLVEKEPAWKPSFSNGEEKDKDEPLAKQLADAALQTGVELFRDQREEPYAAVRDESGRRVLAVEGRRFERFLGRIAWEELGVAVNREALATARGVLASRALFEGPEHPLESRLAEYNGAVWLDLDGRRAVRAQMGKALPRGAGGQRRIPRRAPGLLQREGNSRQARRLLELVHLALAAFCELASQVLRPRRLERASQERLEANAF